MSLASRQRQLDRNVGAKPVVVKATRKLQRVPWRPIWSSHRGGTLWMGNNEKKREQRRSEGKQV
jgi:hypothetical protein